MIREITIRPALNGYIVTVGCKTVVMASKEALLLDLKSYLDNPRQVEQSYLKSALNKEEEKCPPPASHPECPNESIPGPIRNLRGEHF